MSASRGPLLAMMAWVLAGLGCRPDAVEPPDAVERGVTGPPVVEPESDCEAAVPEGSTSLQQPTNERWVRVERGAKLYLGGGWLTSTPSEVAPPFAAVLLADQGRCTQAALRGPTWELYFAVATEDLAPVITERTHVAESGEPEAGAPERGLWLAPGAPVVIDLDGERPRVRLRVRGIEASGTVTRAVVGKAYQPNPFGPGTGGEHGALRFDAAMPLFSAPDRGAFAVLELRAGGLALGDGAEVLPMTVIATFTTVAIGRTDDWTEVIVRADDGSYELRGLTPPSAVRPQSAGLLAVPGPGPVRLPTGTELRTRQGVTVGRTTAEGRYRTKEGSDGIWLEVPWGSLEVFVEQAPRE